MKGCNLAILCAVLLFAASVISCSPGNDKDQTTESSAVHNFESIEKGVSLVDARKQLTTAYTEQKLGSNPEVVVFMFENGDQLAFVDGILTDKNTASELEKILETKPKEE
jgi:hypothetical protein